MSDTYIYKQNDPSNKAYLLEKGTVTLELNETENFELKGPNLLFGFLETLLQEELGSCPRLLSARIDSDSTCQEIPPVEIRWLLAQYESGFSICQTIAQTLIHLDTILIKKKDKLNKKERSGHECCKLYSEIVDKIGESYNAYRYPWLENLYSSMIVSVTYVKGKSFSSLNVDPNKSTYETDFQQLDRYTKSYLSGAYVCQQGDEGNELYILRRGKLKIYINNHPITEIDKPGTVIGEMIFFLGESRTASIQVIEDTSLAIIKKEDLEKILKDSPNFLKTLATNIANRVFHHCNAIEKLNKDLVDGVSNEPKEKEELKDLRTALSNLYMKHKDMGWLYELFEDLSTKMKELKIK
ncbi:MAG: hypothetical protein IEMM0008_0683 [bacterium]|nr:MAG: hypothetical protein IEMM0008_0683 [bacterium]